METKILRLILFALCIEALLCKGSQAGESRWTNLWGLEGGIVVDIAVAPSDAEILFAATRGDRVYKSTNSGDDWSRASEGIGTPYMTDIAIDPRDLDIIFVATEGNTPNSGLYKSTDGGTNWRHLNNLQGIGWHCVQAIAIAPNNSSIIYASYYVFTYAVLTGIQKTVDGGESWRDISAGIPYAMNIHSIVVDPVDSEIVYAGGENGVYRTTNGGENWYKTALTRRVNEVVIDPKDHNNIYAAANSGAGIYRCTDGGESWTEIGNGLLNNNVKTLAVDPFASDILYAGTWGGGIFKSTDGGANWDHLDTETGFGRFVYSIEISPGGPVVVAVGGGVLRSIDGGVSWTIANNGLTAGIVVTELCVTEEALYVGSVYNGIYQYSFDGKEEWVELGLYDRYIESVLVSPNNDVILAGLSHYLISDTASVYKTTDAGGHWVPSDSGIEVPDLLEEMPIFVMKAHPQDSLTVFGGSLNGIYKTSDGGNRWVYSFGDGPTVSYRVFDIAIDPQDYNRIFICGEGGYFDGLIFLSTDGGQDWNFMWTTGLDGICTSIEIDPQSPENLFVGVGSPFAHGVFKSVDGGYTWSQVLGQDSRQWITSLVISPLAPNIIYAGARSPQGVYRTTDGGQSWSQINEGLTTLDVYALVIDPNDPRTLYAGTYGGGVFAYIDSLPMKGDLNRDGSLNVFDIIRMVNIILGILPPPTEYELWAADFNEDGHINVLDIVRMVNEILLIHSPPFIGKTEAELVRK